MTATCHPGEPMDLLLSIVLLDRCPGLLTPMNARPDRQIRLGPLAGVLVLLVAAGVGPSTSPLRGSEPPGDNNPRPAQTADPETGPPAAGTSWYSKKTRWHGFDRFHFQVAGRDAYLVVPSTPLK